MLAVVGSAALLVIALLLIRQSGGPATRIRPLIDAGRLDEAERALDAALKERPDDGRLIVLRGRLLAAREDWASAAAAFSLIPGAVTLSEDRLVWGDCLLQQEKWEDALDVLKPLVEQTPEDAELWDKVVQCQVRLRRPDRALQSAQRLEALPAGRLRGHYWAAQAHEQMDQLLEAVERYQALLDDLPTTDVAADLRAIDLDEVLVQLADLLVQDGRAKLAVEILDRYLPSTEHVAVHYFHGAALELAGRDADARQQWAALVAREPNHRPAREGLARIALRAEQPEQAVDWLTPAAGWSEVTPEVAFLMLRAQTALKDRTAVALWARRAAYLRQWEVARRAVSAPSTKRRAYWERVLYCHRLAFNEEWESAGSIAEALANTYPSAFVLQLVDATRTRSDLPSLEQLAEELLSSRRPAS